MGNTFTEGKKRLNGSFGFLQVNGEDWGEVSGVQIKVTATYTDVQRGMDLDAKMTGRSGTGTISTIKAYTRSKALLDSIKSGKEPSVKLVAWVADPDAQGGKEERVCISNIKFTDIDILTFTHGSLMTAEYPFRFNPSDLEYQDTIEA